MVVWFDAWKYEKEKYLAVVPFLRTIKVALENSAISRAERWNKVRKGLEHTFTAFVNSININFGLGSYGSAQIDLSKFMDILKTDGFTVINGERIQYHAHVTDKNELDERLKERGFSEEEIMRLLRHSSLPTK